MLSTLSTAILWSIDGAGPVPIEDPMQGDLSGQPGVQGTYLNGRTYFIPDSTYPEFTEYRALQAQALENSPRKDDGYSGIAVPGASSLTPQLASALRARAVEVLERLGIDN